MADYSRRMPAPAIFVGVRIHYIYPFVLRAQDGSSLKLRPFEYLHQQDPTWDIKRPSRLRDSAGLTPASLYDEALNTFNITLKNDFSRYCG